jgi:hypothetical protein
MAALRKHQFGACARRFPDLLRDLVEQELELPDMAPGSCDPALARILALSLTGSERFGPGSGNNNLTGEFRSCLFTAAGS